ncbi:molybdate ABC transporter substrate-binding protein [Alkalisalibacterium limincola]|nr:molybdate ABC transporter substrate-binding protein [Alkalisalibacterium limincola]
MHRAHRFAALLVVASILAPAPLQAARDVPVVAAASDLQFALEVVAEAFTAETGQQVRLSFGSTGNLARQIRAGAPFEVFLSADEQFVLDLHRDGHTLDAGRLYAVGRLVIVRSGDSKLIADGSLADLAEALADGRVSRFAIANPEHAPYGMRAREALQQAGLWEAIQPRLVLGENVSQAAQFAVSGNADGGLVAWSLTFAPGFMDRADVALVPESMHAPLRQRMVRVKHAGAVADAFYEFVAGAAARDILARYGFVVPGDE